MTSELRAANQDSKASIYTTSTAMYLSTLDKLTGPNNVSVVKMFTILISIFDTPFDSVSKVISHVLLTRKTQHMLDDRDKQAIVTIIKHHIIHR